VILALLQGADTLIFLVSTVIGIAGTVGVAYAVFRSSSEQKLRELDGRIIQNQKELQTQLEAEISKERQLRIAAEQKAETYRSDLTQKAAVEHLAEMVQREEKERRVEHQKQIEFAEMQTTLLKDLIASIRGQRGTLH
jgi:CO dehydrogenase/acetyl-CoA synthase beta subunit